VNKVDLEVKNCLINYPGLFKNRLGVLNHIFACNGNGYGWNDKGEVVPLFDDPKENETPEQMVTEFQKKLDEANAKADGAADYISGLYNRFVIEAKYELAKVQLVADNIDIMATEFVYFSEYNQKLSAISRFISHQDMTYWLIHPSRRPEVIDEDWRLAIRGWCSEYFGTLNSYHGVDNRTTNKWTARNNPDSQYIFNGIHEIYNSLTTDGDREKLAAQSKIANRIIDKILKEERAAK